MFTQLKSALLILVFAAVVVPWTGCAYDRHGRPSDHERPRQHDRAPDHAELDIRVHG
jgi:hypothetical protein